MARVRPVPCEEVLELKVQGSKGHDFRLEEWPSVASSLDGGMGLPGCQQRYRGHEHRQIGDKPAHATLLSIALMDEGAQPV